MKSAPDPRAPPYRRDDVAVPVSFQNDIGECRPRPPSTRSASRGFAVTTRWWPFSRRVHRFQDLVDRGLETKGVEGALLVYGVVGIGIGEGDLHVPYLGVGFDGCRLAVVCNVERNRSGGGDWKRSWDIDTGDFSGFDVRVATRASARSVDVYTAKRQTCQHLKNGRRHATGEDMDTHRVNGRWIGRRGRPVDR
jgi:hypothetical protein